MGNCNSKSTVEKDPSKGEMLGRPTFRGTETTRLFNGLLYRIIDEDSGQWAFFNNSKDYEFHIKYLFGADSTVHPLENTKMDVEDDGILCSTVVFPLETKMFVKGNLDGYESKLEALPLSEEYFGMHPEIDEQAYYRRLEAPKSKDF